jgi:hypothetical protein
MKTKFDGRGPLATPGLRGITPAHQSSEKVKKIQRKFAIFLHRIYSFKTDG